MRRRPVVALVAAAWLGSAAWLGCNALLGIEGAETAAVGDDASSSDASVVTDAAVTSDGSASPDVDPGPCVNTSSNPRHCGACGRDCFGGDCIAGKCQLVVVSNEEGRPTAVTADGEHVYWTNPSLGDLRRAKVDGGPVEILYDGPPGTPFGERLVRQGEDIYFSLAEATDGGVYRCPRAGCKPFAAPVGGALAQPDHFDIVGGALVVAENVYSGRILRCALPCAGPPEIIATDERFPTFVTASGNAVLWDTLIPVLGNVRVGRAGVYETIVTNTPTRELRVEGETLFYAVRGGGVFASALDGGATRRLSTSFTQTDHFAMDPTEVFYSDALESGRILRCARTGCGDAGVLLARDQVFPHDVATASEQVFWTNLSSGDAGGGVFRIRK